MGIQGMVTRKGWNGETWGANQRISVDEALRVNTINGAYASHEEDDQGLDHAGKLADFVVLADDPHTVDPEQDQGHRDRAHRDRRQHGLPGVDRPARNRDYDVAPDRIAFGDPICSQGHTGASDLPAFRSVRALG